MSYKTIEINKIEMVGVIWQGIRASYVRTLSQYDIDNIKARANGAITRDAVSDWLDCNSGDFQFLEDFHADIQEIDIPWNKEENELFFLACEYPEMEYLL